MINHELEDFLVDFSQNNDLNGCITCCGLRKRTSTNQECKVISMALLGVLNEIENYLHLYEERVEKVFEGRNTPIEFERIQNDVFTRFLGMITSQSINSTEDGLNAVSIFIEDWVNFEKEPLVHWKD